MIMSHKDQDMGSPALAPIQFPIHPNFNFPPIPPGPVPPAPGPAIPGLPANTPEWITLFCQMLNQMQTIVANQPALAPCPMPVLQNMVKFSDPPQFSSKPKDVDAYVKTIQSCINNATKMFLNDSLKTSFFGCWLSAGVPEKWYHAVCKSQPYLLNNYPTFVQAFIGHFGDPDSIKTAHQQLGAL